jgi:hypothetical protein
LKAGGDLLIEVARADYMRIRPSRAILMSTTTARWMSMT